MSTHRKISIYVVGPSSTGKTTLCNALAQKLGIPHQAYVTEVARQVMKDKGYSRDTVSLVQMQQDIMDAYFRREEELEVADQPICLFDRSAVDPVVYAILTANTPEEIRAREILLTENKRFQKTLQKYRSSQSIFILLNPVEEWLVDDGVRSLENQVACAAIFKRLLKNLNIEYQEFGTQTWFIWERVTLALGLARM